MEKRTKNDQRRSQRDYSLAFKLHVVQQVEKGELTYKKLKNTTASKDGVLYWFGYVNMVL